MEGGEQGRRSQAPGPRQDGGCGGEDKEKGEEEEQERRAALMGSLSCGSFSSPLAWMKGESGGGSEKERPLRLGQERSSYARPPQTFFLDESLAKTHHSQAGQDAVSEKDGHFERGGEDKSLEVLRRLVLPPPSLPEEDDVYGYSTPPPYFASSPSSPTGRTSSASASSFSCSARDFQKVEPAGATTHASRNTDKRTRLLGDCQRRKKRSRRFCPLKSNSMALSESLEDACEAGRHLMTLAERQLALDVDTCLEGEVHQEPLTPFTSPEGLLKTYVNRVIDNQLDMVLRRDQNKKRVFIRGERGGCHGDRKDPAKDAERRTRFPFPSSSLASCASSSSSLLPSPLRPLSPLLSFGLTLRTLYRRRIPPPLITRLQCLAEESTSRRRRRRTLLGDPRFSHPAFSSSCPPPSFQFLEPLQQLCIFAGNEAYLLSCFVRESLPLRIGPFESDDSEILSVFLAPSAPRLFFSSVSHVLLFLTPFKLHAFAVVLRDTEDSEDSHRKREKEDDEEDVKGGGEESDVAGHWAGGEKKKKKEKRELTEILTSQTLWGGAQEEQRKGGGFFVSVECGDLPVYLPKYCRRTSSLTVSRFSCRYIYLPSLSISLPTPLTERLLALSSLQTSCSPVSFFSSSSGEEEGGGGEETGAGQQASSLLSATADGVILLHIPVLSSSSAFCTGTTESLMSLGEEEEADDERRRRKRWERKREDLIFNQEFSVFQVVFSSPCDPRSSWSSSAEAPARLVDLSFIFSPPLLPQVSSSADFGKLSGRRSILKRREDAETSAEPPPLMQGLTSLKVLRCFPANLAAAVDTADGVYIFKFVYAHQDDGARKGRHRKNLFSFFSSSSPPSRRLYHCPLHAGEFEGKGEVRRVSGHRKGKREESEEVHKGGRWGGGGGGGGEEEEEGGGLGILKFLGSASRTVRNLISGASPPSHSSCSSSSLSAVAHLSNDFSLPFPPTACLLGEEKRELFLPSPSTEEEEDDDEEDEEDDDGLSCNSVDDPRSRDLSYFSPYSLPAEEGTEEEEGGSRRGGGQGGGREVFGEREEEECWTGEERGRDGQDGEGSSFSIGSIPREEYLKDVMDVSLFPASQAQLGEGFLPSWLQPKWLTGGRGGGGGGERQDAYQTSGSPSWLLSGLECIAYLPALVWQEKLLSSSSSSTSSSCSSCEEEKTSYEEGDRATAERDLSLEARQGWFSSLFKTWERRGGFFSRGGIASQGQQQGSSSASFSPDFPGSSSVLRSLQGEPEHRSCPWREEEEIRAGHQAMSARSFLSVVDVIPSMTLSQNPTLSLVTSKGDRVSLRLVASSLPASPSSLLADTQKLRRTQRRDPVREGEGRVDRCCGLPFCRQSNASLLAYRLEVLSVLPSPCTLSPSSSSLLLSRVLPFGCSPTKTESFEDRHASVENSRVFGGVSRGSYSARGLLSSAWHHRQTTDFSPSSLSPPPRSLLSRGVESRSRVDNRFSLPFFSFSPPAPCCHFYNNGLFLFSSQSPHLVSSAGGLADSLSDRSSTFISLRLSLPASSPSSFFLSSYLPLDLPSPPIAAAESSLLWPSQGSASSTFSSYPIEGLPPSLSLPAASSPFPAPFSSSSSSFPSCFSYSSPFSGFFPSSLLDQTSSPSATSHLLSSPSSASTRHHPRVQRGKEEDSSSMIPYIPESLLLHRRLLIATGDEILLLSVDRTPAYLSSSRQGGSNDADQHPSLLPSSSLPVYLY